VDYKVVEGNSRILSIEHSRAREMRIQEITQDRYDPNLCRTSCHSDAQTRIQFPPKFLRPHHIVPRMPLKTNHEYSIDVQICVCKASLHGNLSAKETGLIRPHAVACAFWRIKRNSLCSVSLSSMMTKARHVHRLTTTLLHSGIADCMMVNAHCKFPCLECAMSMSPIVSQLLPE
jgi:hypothetical protein